MFVKIENLISLFQNLPQILYNVIPIRRVFTRRTQFSCNIVEKTFKIQEKRCNIKTRTNLAKSCKVNRHCNFCCHTSNKNIPLQDLSRPLGRSFTKSSQFCEMIYPTLFSLFFTKTRFSQISFSIFLLWRWASPHHHTLMQELAKFPEIGKTHSWEKLNSSVLAFHVRFKRYLEEALTLINHIQNHGWAFWAHF